MSETWAETKARLAKQGITLSQPIESVEPPKSRYEDAERTPDEPRFDLRRTVLPGAKVDWLVINATRQDIAWWIEHKHRFKKIPEEINGIPAVELLEVVPAEATEEERSPYYNPRPFIVDEGLS